MAFLTGLDRLEVVGIGSFLQPLLLFREAVETPCCVEAESPLPSPPPAFSPLRTIQMG